MSVKYGKLAPLRYDARAKPRNARDIVRYMLARTQALFVYQGLPETIPRREYELILQTNGNVAITKVNGKLYALAGGLGGEPNPYYFPTIYTVANPALKFSKALEIGKDCELVRNDSMYIGLLPLLEKYAVLMAENELSMKIADVNSRILGLVAAGTDAEKASAEEYFRKIEAGDPGVIASNAFLDSIKAMPYGSAGQQRQLTDLIEYEQYLKASLYNELGLNSNYNMKRESLAAGEIDMNQDAIKPFVDDMLDSRRECWERVNKMFGTNVTVDLGSAWKEAEQEQEQEQEPKQEGGAEDGNEP